MLQNKHIRKDSEFEEYFKKIYYIQFIVGIIIL